MSRIKTAAGQFNFNTNVAGAVVSDRRGFLKGSAGVGAAFGLSTLAACSGDDTQGPVIENIVTEKEFLNLKSVGDTTSLYFVQGAQISKVQPITKEILDAALQQKPYLSAVSSGITHYVEGVKKCVDLMGFAYIKRVAQGADPKTSGQMIRTVSLFTEDDARDAYLKLTSKPSEKSSPTKKRLASENATLARSSYSDLEDHAVTCVLQHPELTSTDPETTAVLRAYISAASDFPAFVSYLQSSPDTWSTSEPMTAGDGTPVMLNDGTGNMVNPSVTNLSQQTLEFITGIANEVLLLVNDDRTLTADIGDLQPGDPALDEFAGCVSFIRDGATPYSLKPDFYDTNAHTTKFQRGWQLAEGSSASAGGLTIRMTSPDAATVSTRITNRLHRYMGVYATYYGEDGRVIKQYDDLDALVSPQFFLCGIPVLESFLDVNINIPAGCTRFDLVCAGAGKATSNNIPDSVSLNGALWTYGFIIVPPPLFIAAAAAASLTVYWETLKQLKDPMKKFIFAGKTYYYSFLAIKNPRSADVNQLAKHLTADFLSTPELYVSLAGALGAGSLLNAVPFGFIGTAIAVANAAGDFARGIEAITTQQRDTVTRFVYGNTVRVTPQFPSGNPPAGTRGYVYTLKTTGGWVQQYTSTLAVTIDFRQVPMNTGISISIAAYGGDNFSQAVGSREVLLATGDYSTFNASTTVVTQADVPMTQVLRELKPTSRYKKLAITVGQDSRDSQSVPAISWFAASLFTTDSNGRPLPVADIVAEPITAVGNMTINSSTLFVGRTWSTQESSVLNCVPGTSISAGTRHLFGNSSTRYNNADRDPGATTGYFVSGQAYDPANATYGGQRCGFSVPPLVAYDNFGFNSNRNYYLDPDSGYMLRRINFFTYPTSNGGVAIGDGDIARRPGYDAPGSRIAVGRFNSRPTALLVHPSGKVVAVCAEASTIEVLMPLDAPVNDQDVPVATVVARTGESVGNVSSPVGLASTAEGVLVVAENGNGRLQAFDLDGNPVKLFKGGTARTAALYRWKAGIEVLDLCIENGGFIYVLSADRSSGSKTTTLDIYKPDGSWLVRQENLDILVLTVDNWRSMFTMNGGSTNLFGFRNYVPEPAITFWTL
jgi:hypothetical protein